MAYNCLKFSKKNQYRKKHTSNSVKVLVEKIFIFILLKLETKKKYLIKKLLKKSEKKLRDCRKDNINKYINTECFQHYLALLK